MLTRRKLLGSAAVGVPALALAGCATMPIGGISTNILDFIQNAVNIAAQYIPTAESIASLAASLFGPGWAALVQVGSSALNTLLAALESVVNNTPPAAQARLHARLRSATPSAPIVIGVVNGIAITGYR